jgi:hypothetical protein
MGASSVTGRGKGSAKRNTSRESSLLNNGPIVIMAGSIDTDTNTILPSSPPDNALTATVTFPYALKGRATNYVVMLTTQNGGKAQVTNMIENDNNDFSGFSVSVESGCDLMYMVVRSGVRPRS